MLNLITIDTLKKLINTIGIEDFILDVMNQLKSDFSRWDEFKKMPRHVMHYPHGVMELMPSADDEYYAVKYVNGHPKNPADNLQTVVAMGLFADVATGYPLMISEMTLLTAIRTAAVSALVSQYLARKDSHTMAIIGTGSQSEFQVLAHRMSLGIKNFRYFDIDVKAMDKFEKNLTSFNVKLIRCSNAAEAVEGADIITTATADKQQAQILQNDMIKEGVHINGIGGDCAGKTELDPDILHRAKIVIEYMEQTQVEGEIQHIDPSAVHAELWELVVGNKSGRESNTEVTLFDSVGFALEDYSILKYVYQQTQLLKAGEYVHMIPDIDNPKDLFGVLI